MCQGHAQSETVNEHRGERYLVGSESDFASAAGAAAYVTIVAHVTDSIGKLRLQADVAGGVQLNSCFLLLLRSLSYRLLEHFHFVLLSPETSQREITAENSAKHQQQSVYVVNYRTVVRISSALSCIHVRGYAVERT